MNNQKNDYYYLNKVLIDVNFIVRNTEKLNKKEIISNEILLDSIFFRLIQISENIKKLSITFKENYKEFPLYEVLGFRNKIVHDYGNIDYSIVYQTIKIDIPNLKNMIENIIYVKEE